MTRAEGEVPPPAPPRAAARGAGLAPRPILDATFRANPRYELVSFERLPRAQQVALQALTADPSFYGLLLGRREPPENLPAKQVCTNTALLFCTLREPGPLPMYLLAHDAECNAAIAELVAEGVLEIEVQGAFVSGVDASSALYTGILADGGPGILAQLSIEALRYAEALELDDVLDLSARLYSYNRQPLTALWTRRFPSEESLARHLGIAGGGPMPRTLAAYWAVDKSDGWIAWRRLRKAPDELGQRCRYKLYLSPQPEAVPAVLAALVEVATERGYSCFKIGHGLAALLRPDKIVAYFETYEALALGARELREAVPACPVQGVPFTAAVGEDGLVSWGIDPPSDEYALPWERSESWRVWITNRLARALVDARAAGGDSVEPWRYALQRIAAAGVDPTTWVPSPGLWSA